MMSSKAKFKRFDPLDDCNRKYPVQTVQDLFRYTDSFENSLESLKNYERNIMKPVNTVYNELTKEIEYDRHIEAIWE